MRLRMDQFVFRSSGINEFRVSASGKTRVLARIVRDSKYATMWRVVRPDGGGLSDMVNLARAKDVAFGIVESAIFVNKRTPAESP
jgi:hypothetical protein